MNLHMQLAERKYASVGGNGTTIVLVAAQTDPNGNKQRIVLLHYSFDCDKTGSLIFKSASTALNGSGRTPLAAGNVSDTCESGIVATVPGEALNLGNASGVAVNGCITYLVL